MLGRLATVVGYTKAPRTTFMMKHPVKGTKALVAAKGLKGLVTTKAGAALGAMVAVPLGLIAWRARGRRNNRD